RTVALVAFEGVAEAVAAVAAWRSALDSLEAAELVLAGGVELVCQAFDLRPPFARPWPAYVVAEVADHRDPTDDLSAVVAASAGVGDVAVATDAAHRASLWRYREDHTLAINTLGPPHKFDVSVPLGAVADIADSVAGAIASARPAARTWIFGHVGDGNLHVNVSGLPPDDQGIDEVVLRHIAEAGGSISAEHGIGTAKRRWLHLTRSADELAAQRAVKAALDPYGILNPHVLLPPP
ncbi:MAG TPA: FAD-linked oxidase C-terminal domain-containing protein, partial [Acidimicrobiales bacterium]